MISREDIIVPSQKGAIGDVSKGDRSHKQSVPK